MIGTSSWPQLVGYRHEILHTGVLAALLEGEHGTAVAGALLDERVDAVNWWGTERRLPGRKGRADLEAELRLASGAVVRLGVETKVDSNASVDQLRSTAEGPDQRGVFFALGRTAFALTEYDLTRLEVSGWRAVGPRAWAELLRSVGADRDGVLGPYLDEVEREAASHERAAERAQRGGIPEPPPEPGSREGHALSHAAWLNKVCERVTSFEPRRFDTWWTSTIQGGPITLLWSDALNKTVGDRDVFLQISCTNRRRTLGLKVGGGSGDPQRAAAILSPASDAARLPDRPRRSGKTFTVASEDLSALGSEQAAERVRDVLDDLLGHFVGGVHT